MVFILQFVNMVYHIDCFVYIEESLHPWDKSHLIMVMIVFLILNYSFVKTSLLLKPGRLS